MKPITAVIVGCGHRSRVYAEIALKCPDQLKIVALVDPDKHVRDMCKELYGVPEDKCFNDISEILPMGKIADCVINGTMDKLHIPTSIPLLEQGYDMLLEKPITNNAEELLRLYDVVKKHGNKVMICHVLRYSDFYKTAKEIINSGEIGEVVSVSEAEDVHFVHYWLSFLHGNWHSEESSSSVILQKCCHDFDIISWLIGKNCVKVSSMGNLAVYKKENKPAGAADYCCDCKYIDDCEYSGIRIMTADPEWLKGYYPDMTCDRDGVVKVLSDKNCPFSECAFSGKNDVMTDQIVNMQYEDGVVAQMIMSGFSGKGRREITIHGSRGEIYGYMGVESVKIFYRPFMNPEVVYDLTSDSVNSGHGGGDESIIRSFVAYLRDGIDDGSLSKIEDSLMSHKIAFAAEQSRKKEGQPVKI